MRLRRLEPVLRRALRGPCALPAGGTLLVAVSGGADSIALLLGLQGIAREFGLGLYAAHLHHGLRGAEADGDLEFVRERCARLGIPLAAARWNTPARMRRRGLSGENGLRVLRREFLLAAMRRVGAQAIATAHTADDQMETVLMRLVRGAGLAGLGGMSARRGRWLKPLLEATRADVEADLRGAGEPWRVDSSNGDPRWARNRVRHDAVPALIRAIAPSGAHEGGRASLARRVARTAREAREAERALRSWIARGPSPLSRARSGAIRLDSRAVGSYPIAVRRTILRRAWAGIAPSGLGLTRRHLAALCNLLRESRPGSRLDLPGGIRAECSGSAIRLRQTHAACRNDLEAAASHP
jgi:tRNA(Ile)-lysidine synthase